MNDLLLQFGPSWELTQYNGSSDVDFVSLSEESIGQSIYDLFPSDIVQHMVDNIEKAIQTGMLHGFEYQHFTSGSHYQLRVIKTGEEKVSVIISNISDYKLATDKIKHLAYHDTLTDLPNRYLFTDRLKQAIAQAERSEKMLAIFFLDIDNFKHINDTIGHKAGDQLLQGIGNRLAIAMRRTDSISRLNITRTGDDTERIVARLGGDEFTMLLTEVADIQTPAKVAKRILNILSEPFTIAGQEVFVTASIGIAVYPVDGKDLDTLLMNADVAMYQAKGQGKNNFQYYSESMNTFSKERFSVENKLRKALDYNEFMLFYQPQVDISSGMVFGVEALIRWLQPDLVLIKPGRFIPLAEETGLIIPIGEWVLRTACAENKLWQKAGLRPLRMTVNVSGIQFRQDNFVEMVNKVLRDTQLDPQYLQLELTESTLMQDLQNAIKKLQALRDMGLQIAIDDFGTGYSSMAHLKRFPLSTLKIDYSFVRDLATSQSDQSVVKAIVNLAHNFNLKVIAEGVENSQQLAFLRECGCEGVQGYLICPPVNSIVLAEFIKKEKQMQVLKSYGIKPDEKAAAKSGKA